MASRSSQRAAPAPSSRQNEYFVPRDGIDREVISADICRYLGNDALVRPGMYENPQNGSVTPGYYITAYRNLTTAMIEDLKADSARWENERRAQNSRHSGVSYHQSETHQSRQHYGPTEAPHPQDPYARDRPYPGTNAPGYSGSNTYNQAGPSQSQPQQSYSGGGYPSYQPPGQKSTDARYTSPAGGSMMPPPQGYPQDSYVATGANNNIARGGYSAAPPQPVYATTAPQQPSYPATASYSSYGNQPAMHPQDPFMGRGGQPGQQQGYSNQPPQPQQYSQPPPSQSQHSSSDRHRSRR
ncbi:transcription factor RfeG [Sarocladium implicatum]|nr:transcription factor RfeG [Sarocladium implicatum]